MDKKLRQPISRRQFIKGLSVGAGILSVGRLDVVQAALLPAAERKERFGVLVIGTGLAGISAALEAQSAGKKVAALDKMPLEDSSGNSRFAKRNFPDFSAGRARTSLTAILTLFPNSVFRRSAASRATRLP